MFPPGCKGFFFLFYLMELFVGCLFVMQGIKSLAFWTLYSCFTLELPARLYSVILFLLFDLKIRVIGAILTWWLCRDPDLDNPY